MEWELTCTECSFTTVVEGTISDAHGAIDDHQEECGEGHFMNVHKLAD